MVAWSMIFHPFRTESPLASGLVSFWCFETKTKPQRANLMSNENLFLVEALPQLDALRNFAFKLCRDQHYTNDLVQETMLKACKSFHTYQRGTNCRAWLFQICKNSYINDYRRKQYETIPVDFAENQRGEEGGDEWRAPHVCLADPASFETHGAIVGDEVASALEALPVEYQTVLLLSDVEGYTYDEVAAFVKAPIGTVRSRIHRARKMLAERLESYARHQGYEEARFTKTN
jgi:RNA polymerase sigma factor (sigma-70 family)